MEKVKQAWERVKESAFNADGDAAIYEIGDLETVEKALDQAEKNDRVSKVLKDKKVDVAVAMECETLEDYNDAMNSEEIWEFYRNTRKLTKTEFDLIKEWLKR